MKVHDPSQVRIDVDDGAGERTLLPAAAVASEVPLPSSEPPYVDPFRPPTWLRRQSAGPIEIRCEGCEPRQQVLVPMNGTIVFGDDFRVTHFDWTSKEMKIRFGDLRTMGSAGASFEASIATPWSNVDSVTRVSKPDRSMGVKLLVSGALGGFLGGFAIADGVGKSHTGSTAFGVPIALISVALLAGGAWYALAPERPQTLYRADSPAAAPTP